MRRHLIIYTLLLLTAVSAVAQTPTCPECTRDTVDGKPVYRYKVQKSEGLYRISKNFGVKQEEIVALNPVLQQDGLKLDQIILIPDYGCTCAQDTIKQQVMATPTSPAGILKDKSEAIKLQHNTVANNDIVAAAFAQQTTAEVLPDSMPSMDTDSTFSTQLLPIRLAYLLPLMTNQAKRDPSIDRYLEFYEGALLAIRDVQAEGQPIEVYTYDTEKSDSRVRQILDRPELAIVDALIGPALASQVGYACEFAQNQRKPILVPFVSHTDNANNPYILQFNPSVESEAKVLVSHIGEQANWVLIEGNDLPQSISALHQEIKKRDLPYTTTSLHAILADSLSESLVKGTENILVMHTDKYSAAQMVMNKLAAVQKTFRLSLLSRYNWQKESLPVPQIYTSVFNETGDLSQYTADYARYFGEAAQSNAPRFDLLGYDLTMMIIRHLQQDGIVNEYNGKQSKIRMERVSDNGGYENKAIEIIRK